jgi:hypothetical protein
LSASSKTGFSLFGFDFFAEMKKVKENRLKPVLLEFYWNSTGGAISQRMISTLNLLFNHE